MQKISAHVFEGFATSPFDQRFNHGYMAVDFFFILSGFVVGYAYDDRWGRTLNIRNFFKRRLIRLHPMVVLGVVLGAITFIIQGSMQWDGTHVAFSMVLLAMLLNLFLIPAVPGTGPEVRGNGEMYPLNGPNWSLFFEYIGNIAYALFLRRLSTKALAVFVAAAGIGNPARFFNTLRNAGLSFSEMPLPDHFDFSPNPFAQIQADRILITEKDAVKCAQIAGLKDDGRLWVVPVRAQFDDNGPELRIVERCRGCQIA